MLAFSAQNLMMSSLVSLCPSLRQYATAAILHTISTYHCTLPSHSSVAAENLRGLREDVDIPADPNQREGLAYPACQVDTIV